MKKSLYPQLLIQARTMWPKSEFRGISISEYLKLIKERAGWLGNWRRDEDHLRSMSRTTTKDQWKAFSQWERNDGSCDPAGGYGLSSHE